MEGWWIRFYGGTGAGGVCRCSGVYWARLLDSVLWRLDSFAKAGECTCDDRWSSKRIVWYLDSSRSCDGDCSSSRDGKLRS